MSAELDFSCIDTLEERLKEIGTKGSKLENKALLEGAEIINKEIINKAPTKRKGSKGSKRYIKKSDVVREKGKKVVKVGVQKEDNSEAYYLKFYEWGTSMHTYKAGGIFKGATVNHPGQIARPFMRPAFEKKKKEAFERTRSVIKEGLGI